MIKIFMTCLTGKPMTVSGNKNITNGVHNMTVPCESKQEITDIAKEQRLQGKDLAVTKDATDHLRNEQAAFIRESREVIGLLKEMAIVGKTQSKQAKEDQNVLFTKARDNQSAIRRIEDQLVEAKAAYAVRITEVVEKIVIPIRDDVRMLLKDKDNRDSKSLLLKDLRVTIPVLCTVLVTGLLLWDKLMGWIG